MKKVLYLMLLFTEIVSAQTVNIPDAALKTKLLTSNCADTNNDGVPDAIVNSNGDGEIQFSEAVAVTSLIVGNGPSNLTGLEAFTNLQHLDLYFMTLPGIDLSPFTQLLTLRCVQLGLTSIDLSMLLNLTDLECSENSLSTLDLSANVNLRRLRCYQNPLTSLDVTMLSNLQTLDCSSCPISSLSISGLANLVSLNCSSNQLASVNLSGLTSLTMFVCDNNNLALLDLSDLTSLRNLSCIFNQLTALDLTGLVQLQTLSCNENNITALSLSHLVNLKELDCSGNQLTALDVSALLQLTHLTMYNNQISAINVAPLTLLKRLNCSNNPLNTLNVTAQTNLEYLICNSNNLSALDLSNQTELWLLNCSNNLLTVLDISNCPYLTDVECGGNLFTSLDFSHITSFSPNSMNHMANSYGNNPNLEYVNLKTPMMQFPAFVCLNCPNLHYICVNEPYINNVLIDFGIAGVSNVEINSYCSFTPGLPHNTIQGSVTFDANSNGCDTNDPKIPYFKVKINDGTTEGAAFTKTTGNYTFFTGNGNFTVTPILENPYFTLSPTSSTVNFSQSGNLQVRDFCVAPIGIHPDLEVVIVPLTVARPGFDAYYRLVFKNKGNQLQSGQISFSFDDAHTDFVSSTPAVANSLPGLLMWNFDTLLPFEIREITFILHINSPTDTPPVDSGALLVHSAQITGGTIDDLPSDNTFILNQTVLNAYDPNDKTCLEGNILTPENIGKYLHYNINFENIGTADAVNVVVKDVIDTAKFDINSLQLLYASHPVETKITGNIVEFIFENINLPPSNMNPIGGHGNVLFKIKTLQGLPVGTEVSNTAGIYFDYNAPIATNVARTTFSALSKTDFRKDTSVSVYPNPARNWISIKADNNIQSVELFDLEGRILETRPQNDKTANLEVSKYAKGIYFIKVVTAKGTSTEKVVKEN